MDIEKCRARVKKIPSRQCKNKPKEDQELCWIHIKSKGGNYQKPTTTTTQPQKSKYFL